MYQGLTCTACGRPATQFPTYGRVCNCGRGWTAINQHLLGSHSIYDLPYLSYIANLRLRTAFYLRPELCPKVSLKRLKESGAHGRDNVLTNYGHDARHSEGAFIDAMKIKLDEERDNVREWAAEEVKKRMQERAITVNVMWRGQIVRKFQDIKKSWTEDGSEENARKMYWVMFGDYEKDSASTNCWSKDMEKRYMEEKGIQCIEDPGRKKRSRGCYQKIISAAKTTQVKMINKNCRLSIKISRGTVPTNQGRRFRRKNGDFFVLDTQTVRMKRYEMESHKQTTHLLLPSMFSITQLCRTLTLHTRISTSISLIQGKIQRMRCS
jgi:hypothetical protein